MSRHLYAKKFMDILALFDESNLYFIDEVGYNISIRSWSGRLLRGARAVHIVPESRNKNHSFWCAMLKNWILSYHA